MHRGQLDVPGAVTATAGAGLLVLAVARAGDTLQATQPALLAAAAIIMLATFVARGRRARAPLLDLALFKDRGIAGANLTLVTVGAFIAAQVLLVTLYLQEGRGLLGAQFALGVAARLNQVASTLAGTRGPVAARSEGTASALLTATRRCGPALGVAIVSATLVTMHGSAGHRTAAAMLAVAGFALAGLLATRVVPPGPPHPHRPQAQHLLHRLADRIP